MKKTVYIHKFKTNLGRFRLASTEDKLAIINFTDATGFKSDLKKRFGDYQVKEGGPINKTAEKQIKSYLAGKLKKFSIKLELSGTVSSPHASQISTSVQGLVSAVYFDSGAHVKEGDLLLELDAELEEAAYEEAEGQALSLEPEATDTRAAEKKA